MSIKNSIKFGTKSKDSNEQNASQHPTMTPPSSLSCAAAASKEGSPNESKLKTGDKSLGTSTKNKETANEAAQKAKGLGESQRSR